MKSYTELNNSSLKQKTTGNYILNMIPFNIRAYLKKPYSVIVNVFHNPCVKNPN